MPLVCPKFGLKRVIHKYWTDIDRLETIHKACVYVELDLKYGTFGYMEPYNETFGRYI